MHLIDDAAPAIVDVLANDKSEPAARDGRDAGSEHPSGARRTRAHHSRRSSRSPSVGPAPVVPGGAGPSGVRPTATEAAAETDPQLERILRQIADQLHSAAEAHERAHHQRHGSAQGRIVGAVSEVFAEGREALSEGYDQVLDLWNHARGNSASAGAPAAAPPVDARVEMPSQTIWEEPLGFLARARVSLGRGEREEAMHELAALRDSATRAHLRFRQYMDRVADGAGAAATSLQGVVALSTMALSILSGAAVVGAGAVAVGAMSGAGAMLGTLATGGAQRASEMRHGLRREADLLGLIESAGIEGLTTMVSALLGGEVSRRMFAALGRRLAATITAEQLAHLQLGREVPLEVLGSALATRLQHVAVSAVSAALQAPVSVALRTVMNDPQRPRSVGAFVDRVVHEMVAGGVLAIVMTLLLGHGRAAPRVVEPSARAPSPQPSTPAAHAEIGRAHV